MLAALPLSALLGGTRMTFAEPPLISAEGLLAVQRGAAAHILVCDCSFDLADTKVGHRAFDEAHIPGAVYLHLDEDLSGSKTGRNGRHPLPDRERFIARLAAMGMDDQTTVVAYDRSAGMYAARLWWLLRWCGHEAAMVLDGGFAAWQAEGGSVESGSARARPAGSLQLKPSLVEVLDHAAVRANLSSAARLVIDARAADRFRGENETLDAVGGHIPGARNRPFRDNLLPDGRFKPAEQLKAEFDAITGGKSGDALIHQCGSGVTACHNLLALEVAGVPGGALYAGSWSEWCRQDGAPIAAGND
jgi:thiosulfate/3-mercaptopyruvate sulfurtransferase